MCEVKNKNGAKYIYFLRQLFVTLTVALNITGHGCVIGFAVIVIKAMRLSSSHIHATTNEESWIASIIGFALVVGNLIITPLMNKLGRKRCHILTTLPVIIGWFIILLVKSVGGLIGARFLQGIAMGMLGPLGSIIIAETTDPRHRGPLLISVSLSLTVGVLFSHTLGAFFSWQECALICSFVTFISLLMCIYNPESPPWLISKGRLEEAREVFIWLRGNDDAELEELEKLIVAHKLIRKSSIVDENLPLSVKTKRFFRYLRQTLKKPEFFKPIIIMIFLYMLFQFAGINVLSSYATDIIGKLVGPHANADLLMVLLDVERLICNIIAVFLVRSFKRRTVLFTSGTICVISYLAKAAYVFLRQHQKLPFDHQAIPIFLIGLYMFSLTVGISSIPFALAGELFPMEYRGLGSGISIICGLSFNFFIAVKSFPILSESIGLPLTYCGYAGVVFMCLVVIWFMLPETKDKTLQEIEEIFKGISAGDRKSAQPLNGEYDEMLRRCSSHIMY